MTKRLKMIIKAKKKKEENNQTKNSVIESDEQSV